MTVSISPNHQVIDIRQTPFYLNLADLGLLITSEPSSKSITIKFSDDDSFIIRFDSSYDHCYTNEKGISISLIYNNGCLSINGQKIINDYSFQKNGVKIVEEIEEVQGAPLTQKTTNLVLAKHLFCHCGTYLNDYFNNDQLIHNLRKCSFPLCHSLICDKHESDGLNLCIDHLVQKLKQENKLLYSIKKDGDDIEYSFFDQCKTIKRSEIYGFEISDQKNDQGLYQLVVKTFSGDYTLEFSMKQMGVDNDVIFKEVAEKWKSRWGHVIKNTINFIQFYSKSECIMRNLNDEN